MDSSFIADHSRITILVIVVVALLVTPLDEVLFVTAYLLLGPLGILLVIVLLLVAFVALRQTRFGQRWWGRAYGHLAAFLD